MGELNADLVILGVLDLAEAKRIRSLLESEGVGMQLISNPETCSSGSCGPGTKVEIWVLPDDVPKVRQLLEGERARLFEGLEVDPERTSSVFDSEKATATCPACGTEFSTHHRECPDCGLGFMAE